MLATFLRQGNSLFATSSSTWPPLANPPAGTLATGTQQADDDRPVVDENGRVHFVVSRDIENLLKLQAEDVPYRHEARELPVAQPPKPAPAASTTASPSTPATPGIFANQTVERLLNRYVAAALQLSPSGGEAQSPEILLGSMLEELGRLPSRAADTVLLRNTSAALGGFLARLREVTRIVCEFKPGLRAEILAYSQTLAAQAVAQALATCGGCNAPAATTSGPAGGLDASVPRPDRFLARVRQRIREQKLEAATRQTQDYFADAARFQIRNALSEKSEHLAAFARGEVEIENGRQNLMETVRHVPAGEMVQDVDPENGRPAGTWHAVYPDTGWRQTLVGLWYHLGGGNFCSVMVALHEGRHSFSLDRGRHWTPTGAVHLPSIEAMRAAQWSAFLALRTEQLENRG